MPPESSPPRRRARRLVLVALAIIVALPAGIVGFAFFYLRHVPWSVPAHMRPPADLLAAGKGGLSVRWHGVTSYEVTDGKTVLLLDPTPTRPTVAELLRGPLAPDERLGAERFPRADFILVNHAHYDHALDVPAIALRTGATVVGSRSACNLARSRGVPEARIREVAAGDRLTLGTFDVQVRASRHASIFGIERPMEGTIPRDAGPLRFWEYRQDATLAYRLEAGGTSIWFHPTSTYAAGELGGGPAARTLILGVNGEPLTVAKVKDALAEARPARVLATHHDNFFQPLARGLALMPGLDIEAARAAVAEAQAGLPFIVLDFGETVHLPPD